MRKFWFSIKILIIISISQPAWVQPAMGEDFQTWSDIATIYKLSDNWRYDGDQGIRGVLSDSDFTIESAARFVGLSRRAYQLALRDLSTSYGAILYNVRKETALRLLDATDEPVGRIAEKTGYRSVSNFSRAFKSWTGKTPTPFSSPAVHCVPLKSPSGWRSCAENR